MKTAVIHSYNGMGDLIWHLPYIHAIAKKTKTKKIILFSKKTTNARELLDADPYIEKIIDLDDTRGIFTNLFSLFKIKNKLKENKIKKIWIFHESIKYAMAGILAGVKERLGYEYGLQKFFLSKKNIMPSNSKTERPFEKARIFLNSHDFKKEEIQQKFFIKEKLLKKIKEKYEKKTKPWIVISTTNKADFKKWTNENFLKLINLILNSFNGTIFIIGAPKEKKLINENMFNLKKSKRIIFSFKSLHNNAAIIYNSSLFIGLDSGAYNLSALIGIKSYAIMGASPPLKHLPTYRAIVPPTGEIKSIIDADKIPKEKGMNSISAEYAFDCIKKDTSLFQ
tara:strand:- start:12822 stop:13835 length:1014 start_codon:yes stop_codon:yes gene_type:complete